MINIKMWANYHFGYLRKWIVCPPILNLNETNNVDSPTKS